jgi:hypothetical protein
MARKVHTGEEILRALQEAEAGDTEVNICRKHAISQRWLVPL